MSDSLIERRQICERRLCTLVGLIPQMRIQPAVSGRPCGLISCLQPTAKPFAHQRMRVKRTSRVGIPWIKQPRLSQPRYCVHPRVVIKTDDNISQPANRRQTAQRR